MSDSRADLIVGGDSLIGSALAERLRAQGRPVLATTRRPERVGGERLFLDLAADPLAWESDRPIGTVYLCAGVTRLEDCRSDPQGSARINVAAASALAARLAGEGAFIVFLSTNQVFDGSEPCPSSGRPPAPRTEYGRQKAAAEAALKGLGDRAAVVRLTKVLGESPPLFRAWAESLSRGERIRPFRDMVMSPLPLPGVVSVLSLIGGLGLPGLWQVSAERDVTYAEAAEIGARASGLDPGLIEPVEAAAAGLPFEHLPTHTTLDTSRLQAELGLGLPPASSTVARVFSRLAREYR